MYLQDVYQVKLLYQQLCTKVRQPKMKKIKKTMQRFPNEKFFSRNQFHEKFLEKFRENDFTKIWSQKSKETDAFFLLLNI